VGGGLFEFVTKESPEEGIAKELSIEMFDVPSHLLDE
jgi:hypothetical protein